MKMPHQNRPSHKLPNTGEFIDGFGNKAYVYAVGNPIKPDRKNKVNRYGRAHLKASGFGVVTMDRSIDATHALPTKLVSGLSKWVQNIQ